MKKFLKLMSFIFVFNFLWVVNAHDAQADLSISVPQKITMYLEQNKFINGKAYFNNEEVDSYDLENLIDEHNMEISIQSVTWKRSNKNISLLYYKDNDIDDLDGNMIDANKIGKTKITLTVKYKEKHFDEYDENESTVIQEGWTSYKTITKSIWVTVKPYKTPQLGGGLYKYDTRENIFKTQIYNPTNRKIRIYSKGAYSLDCDYKKFDRKVKLTRRRKYVDLKPGKWTNVNFKVIGRTTWWKVDDEEIHCKCKFKGKKYTLSIETERIMKWTKNGCGK